MARTRGRNTEKLRRLAEQRFYACEICNEPNSYELIDVVLDKLRLTRGERRRLERQLRCPNCESPVEPLTQVAAYGPAELGEIRRHVLWIKRYATALRSLEELLDQTPSLGGLHPMAATLAAGLSRLSPTTIHQERWYRARTWRDGEVLKPKDFLPPDPHQVYVKPARFNHAGQVGLYVAKDPSDCAVEIFDDPSQESKIWIAEIEFREPLKVLDLGIWVVGEQSRLPVVLEGLRGLLTAKRERADLSPQQYNLSRFVADLARRRGLDGIVYTSSREHPFGPDVFGKNLVILNHQKAKVVWGPTLHVWKRVEEVGLFGFARMGFDPPIPTWWWERERERRTAQSE